MGYFSRGEFLDLEYYCFNLMQPHGLLLIFRSRASAASLFQSYAVARTASFCIFLSLRLPKCFNLMQSHGLRPELRQAVEQTIQVSILCSRTDCVGKDTQRLHFVYDAALCILPFFGCCNYGTLLISHWWLPPFCYVCWCEASSNFMVTYASHYFFICTNYLIFCIYNQPCIVFIYTLYIIQRNIVFTIFLCIMYNV